MSKKKKKPCAGCVWLNKELNYCPFPKCAKDKMKNTTGGKVVKSGKTD